MKRAGHCALQPKQMLEAFASPIGILIESTALLLLNNFMLMHSTRPRSGVPAICVANQGGILASWFQPGCCEHLENEPADEKFSVICLSNKLIFKN